MRPRRIRKARPAPSAGRLLHKLSRDDVADLIKAHKVGVHSDGGSLYLRVRPGAAPAWLFVYIATDGRRRDLTLGRAHDVPLGQARELASDCRAALAAGADPRGERLKVRAEAQAEAATLEARADPKTPTLRREAERLHGLLAPSWKNPKHARQWLSACTQHLPSAILDKPIGEVTTAELVDVLQPLYVKLPETARRVRTRLDATFDTAMMRGLCAGNPAAAIKRTLEKLGRKRKRGHFAALPWKDAPALAQRLRARTDISSRMLEFTMLTASRTGEAIEAQWSEFDLKAGIWTVPGARMKRGEPHTVFLAPRALAILEHMAGLDPRYVFPSPVKEDVAMSSMAMLVSLKRLGLDVETTVHGLRATFSTWANERGLYRSDAIEACLAHLEADRTRAAYNRSEFLAERRQLLMDWAAFLGGEKRGRVRHLTEERAARESR